MKGIPMKTWEVQAILDNRKTVFRRVVKPQPKAIYHDGKVYDDDGLYVVAENQNSRAEQIELPYRPGDILYVQETWQYMGCVSDDSQIADQIVYRAGWNGKEPLAWRSPIHMPRDAARIFLRVTDVRLERLQEISEESAIAEGCTSMIKSARFVYGDLWDSDLHPKDLSLYGWDASPWVWVVEFERISKEEALKNA